MTTTQHTSYVYTITFATVTSGIVTSVINEVTTIATAIWPLTSCTNDVTPVTVTEYTGTYTPLPGQSTGSPESYATEVICSTYLSIPFALHPYSPMDDHMFHGSSGSPSNLDHQKPYLICECSDLAHVIHLL